MTVILAEHKLSYVPVPKVACTSLKTMFFEIENGFAYQPFSTSGRKWWIHDFFKSIPFSDQPIERMVDHVRMAVVRDPVQRLLSCYSNRVVHHQELSKQKAFKQLTEADLPFSPDLSTFVKLLPEYYAAVHTISHHAMPFVDYLGRDPQFYTHIYRIEETTDMAYEVERITGKKATLKRLQNGGPKIGVDALSEKEIAMLKDFYAEDYAVFGSRF